MYKQSATVVDSTHTYSHTYIHVHTSQIKFLHKQTTPENTHMHLEYTKYKHMESFFSGKYCFITDIP